MCNKLFDYGVNTLLWSESFGNDKRSVEIVHHVKELGFDLIDMSIPDQEGFPAKKIAAAIRETGLKAVINCNMTEEANPISSDVACRSRAQERIKRFIDLAYELGAPILSGVIGAAWGYKTNRPRTKTEWERSVDYMRMAGEYAAQLGGLILAVEIINRYLTHFLNTAQDAALYCRAVGLPNVKIHLDSFHMMIEENSFREAIQCAGGSLGFFHACESHRGIPGTGMVPWEALYDSLIKIGYDGALSIESFDPAFSGVASKSCIWRKMASDGDELARKGLAHLKSTEHLFIK